MSKRTGGQAAPEDPDASRKPEAPARRNLERILSIRLPVIAVIAGKRMKLAEVLNLSVGSVIELDKPADELLELMVNDRPVGRGETVRVGENLGLRLVEMGPVHDTIRKLAGTPEEDQHHAPDAE